MARLTHGCPKVIQEVSSKNGIFAVRGVAALLVLFLHISSLLIPQQVWIEKAGPLEFVTPWLFRGEVGVGVFIFLSGFLLTLKIPNTGREWSKFYLRRFSRIYPVYGLLLIVSISTSRLWDLPGFINALFLFPNFPGTLWPAPWLSTAWSLGVEWTLYFLFPLMLFSLRHRGRNIIYLVFFFEFMILFGHTIGTDFHTLVYGSMLGRSIEFMLGMWLALNFNKVRNLGTSKIVYLLLSSYGAFHLWCIWYLQAGGSVSESYLRALQPIAESLFALTLILLSQKTLHKTAVSIFRPLVFVGEISYPLYLTHLIVVDGVKRYVLDQPGTILSNSIGLQSLVIVMVSVVLAWIIHESVEKPGMKLGRTSS